MCELIKKVIAVLLLFATVASGQSQRRRTTPDKPFPAEYLTPLMSAAQAGRLDKVRVLLKGGVDVNEKLDALGGMTALMLAAAAGHLEVVKELLKAGANPNALAGIAHVGFFTPLVMAMNGVNKNRFDLIDTLIAGGAQLNPPVWFHESPLCTALHLNDVELVKALLKRGSDVNWENEIGTTPLGAAVTDGNASVTLVRLLLEAGADPNKPRLWVGDDCVSILQFLDDNLRMSRENNMPRDKVRGEISGLIVQHGGKKFSGKSNGGPCKSW